MKTKLMIIGSIIAMVLMFATGIFYDREVKYQNGQFVSTSLVGRNQPYCFIDTENGQQIVPCK